MLFSNEDIFEGDDQIPDFDEENSEIDVMEVMESAPLVQEKIPELFQRGEFNNYVTMILVFLGSSCPSQKIELFLKFCLFRKISRYHEKNQNCDIILDFQSRKR